MVLYRKGWWSEWAPSDSVQHGADSDVILHVLVPHPQCLVRLCDKICAAELALCLVVI